MSYKLNGAELLRKQVTRLREVVMDFKCVEKVPFLLVSFAALIEIPESV